VWVSQAAEGCCLGQSQQRTAPSSLFQRGCDCHSRCNRRLAWTERQLFYARKHICSNYDCLLLPIIHDDVQLLRGYSIKWVWIRIYDKSESRFSKKVHSINHHSHVSLFLRVQVLAEYNRSVVCFENALRIQPDFEAALKRRHAVLCHAKLENVLETQHRSVLVLIGMRLYALMHEVGRVTCSLLSHTSCSDQDIVNIFFCSARGLLAKFTCVYKCQVTCRW